MSTRACIVITDEYDNKLFFYRHSEYKLENTPNPENKFNGWKVGAYEPTIGIYNDIEYLYHIDLEKKTLKIIPENQWKKFDNKYKP